MRLCTIITVLLSVFVLQVEASVKRDLLLRKVSAYCEKLKKEAFHFYCQEKISESRERQIHKLTTSSRYDALGKRRRITFGDDNTLAGGLRTNIYYYDYQILKEDGKIKESRKLTKKSIRLKRSRISTVLYSYKAALTPVMLFAAEKRRFYDYELGEDGRVMRRKAKEILIRKKGESEVLVRAWVDLKDYSVLKFRVFPGAIKGYEKILHLNKKTMNNIVVEDVHYFGVKRGGIRYPSKTRIQISYDQKFKKGVRALQGEKLYTRHHTLIQYKKYRFFNAVASDPAYTNI